MTDWLCYQFCMWFPIWRLNPRNRAYAFILQHAGRYAFGTAEQEGDLNG